MVKGEDMSKIRDVYEEKLRKGYFQKSGEFP
jgi:hypothetical protein